MILYLIGFRIILIMILFTTNDDKIYIVSANSVYYYENPLDNTRLGQIPVSFVIDDNLESLSSPSSTKMQQYFHQDHLGQYAYGYVGPLSRKEEIRNMDGIVRGSYSYIDPNGLLKTIHYIADNNGFRISGNNLPIDIDYNNIPKPVTETPEVALARQKHLAAHAAILTGDYTLSSILPKPVEDTKEVLAAKKAFFARFKIEQQRQQLWHINNYDKDQIKNYNSMNTYARFLPKK